MPMTEEEFNELVKEQKEERARLREEKKELERISSIPEFVDIET
jgi:hypothetical protein